jgi:hypothetical protein
VLCFAIKTQSPCLDASTLVEHALFGQVPLAAVQSMHAAPPLPQYWSKDPLRHMPDVSQQPPVHVCGPHGGGFPASSGVHMAIMRVPAIVRGAQTSPAAHSAVVAQSWTGPIGVALGQGEGRQALVGWVLVMQHTRPGGAFGLFGRAQSTPLPHGLAKADDEPEPLDPPELLVRPELPAEPEETPEPAPLDAEEPDSADPIMVSWSLPPSSLGLAPGRSMLPPHPRTTSSRTAPQHREAARLTMDLSVLRRNGGSSNQRMAGLRRCTSCPGDRRRSWAATIVILPV